MDNRIKKCISCGDSNFKYYADNLLLKLPMYICQNCKLYVTGNSQQELDHLISTYYEKDFWDLDRKRGMNDEHTDDYSKGRIRLWHSQYKYLKSFFSVKSKILEIGSGHGESLIEFDKLNYDVTGIEPDKKSVKHLKQILKKCKIIESNAENLQLDTKFDFIWMSHVFEHLSNPIIFLNKLKKNIKNNGYLFIEVPNVEKINDYRTFTKTPHTYNYSAKSLKNILEQSGYEIIRCDFFGPPKKINGIINMLYNKFFKKDFYSFYPKMLMDIKFGEDIRLVSRLKLIDK